VLPVNVKAMKLPKGKASAAAQGHPQR